MRLEGSCHCGKVKFSVQSRDPYPFMRCYCSICRKTGGGGGYLINLDADAATLEVEGREHVKIYRAENSGHQRHFCSECGTHLWAYHPAWPEHLHPVASAIDTPLPAPPENVHMMLGSKASWVRVEGKPGDPCFDEYPDQSLLEWHQQHGLVA